MRPARSAASALLAASKPSPLSSFRPAGRPVLGSVLCAAAAAGAGAGQLRVSPLSPSALAGAAGAGFGQVRYATHMSEGRANGGKNGPGPRLGAKQGEGSFVVRGTILFRQRGTNWFAGENAFLGRDHTVHAAVSGYVRYYRDPATHPDRSYIGVVLDRDARLPRAPTEPRPRRLGLVLASASAPDGPEAPAPPSVKPRHRREYVARDPNYLIGRLKNSPAAAPAPARRVRLVSVTAKRGKLSKTKNKAKEAKGKASAARRK